MGLKLNLLALAGAMLVAQPALAAVSATFSLTAGGAAAGLGSGPFGTVTVTDNGNNTLTFSQTLNAGFRIHDGNANHNAFAFSITGDPNLTITGLTGGFAAIQTTSGTNVSAPPFDDFYTAIDCTTACGPGYGGGFAGTLSFTVGRTDLAGLSIASLRSTTYSGSVNPIFFSTDLVNAQGLTGNIGATGNTGAVPEPATWAMMLVGFGAMGVSMRRRRSVGLQTA